MPQVKTNNETYKCVMFPEKEHKKIRVAAARKGISMWKYIVESIKRKD